MVDSNIPDTARHIVMVIGSLQPGGAEKVASSLANAWSLRGDRVSIITLASAEVRPFYALEPKISLFPLDVVGKSANVVAAAAANLGRILRLRRIIKRSHPSVVVSFLTETNVLSLLASLGLSFPVIVSEHTDPVIYPLLSMWKRLRRHTYVRAAEIVVLNTHMQQYFTEHLQRRPVVIPNPISRVPRNETTAAQRIVAMGRFSREKCFDVLVRAFHRVVANHPRWSLIIIGDGELRTDITELVDRLGLTERVTLTGIVREPEYELRQSSIFISTSILEGFPMAICEAMSHGLAVVAVEYGPGIHDIIDDGVNGIVVRANSVDDVAAALEQLIDNPDQRVRLGENARTITDRYGIQRVMGMWESVFQKALESSGG
ncbi:MAG: glycosyltransferase family 4 protein [Gammaproteobacteria bacterium]|nr:glycosyltransferase family 4 protein [Gammaproteobacteria bacterium]MDH3467942.1 glycosyltransferase family 4 protein [Gammaproteobacteria bacterium]